MPTLDTIVSVNIKLTGGGTSREAFDSIVLLNPEGAVANGAGLNATTPIATYTSLSDMDTAGWKPWEQAYIAAKDLLLQSNHPTKFKVGFWDKNGGKTASQALAAIDAVDANWSFAAVLSETVGDITSAGSYCETRSAKAICLGQVADANSKTGAGDAQTVKATNDLSTGIWWHVPPAHLSNLTVSGVIVVGSTINLKVNGIAINPVLFNISSNQTMADIATQIALNADVASAVVFDVSAVPGSERVIRITGKHGKYIVVTNYADTGGASSTGAAQTDVNGGPEWFHVAMVGSRATTQPGGDTWKFGTLTGMTADTLTPTEIGVLQAANCNFYTTYGSTAIPAEGKTAKGEWIDVVRFIGWFETNLQADLFDLHNNIAPEKIPYTDDGIAMDETTIRGRIKNGIKVGGIAADPAPIVTVPKVKDVSSADKLARLLRCTFSFTLAGAIHNLIVNGTVSE